MRSHDGKLPLKRSLFCFRRPDHAFRGLLSMAGGEGWGGPGQAWGRGRASHERPGAKGRAPGVAAAARGAAGRTSSSARPAPASGRAGRGGSGSGRRAPARRARRAHLSRCACRGRRPQARARARGGGSTRPEKVRHLFNSRPRPATGHPDPFVRVGPRRPRRPGLGKRGAHPPAGGKLTETVGLRRRAGGRGRGSSDLSLRSPPRQDPGVRRVPRVAKTGRRTVSL